MFPLIGANGACQEGVRGIPGRRGGPPGDGSVGGNVEDLGKAKMSPQRDPSKTHQFGGDEEIAVLLELEELGRDIFAFGGGDHFEDGESSGVGNGGQASDRWRVLYDSEGLEPPSTGACAVEVDGIEGI